MRRNVSYFNDLRAFKENLPRTIESVVQGHLQNRRLKSGECTGSTPTDRNCSSQGWTEGHWVCASVERESQLRHICTKPRDPHHHRIHVSSPDYGVHNPVEAQELKCDVSVDSVACESVRTRSPKITTGLHAIIERWTSAKAAWFAEFLAWAQFL
jgi:hypothetical protein